MDILDAELDVGDAPVVILHYRITDVHRISVPDMFEMFGLVESYGRKMMVRLSLLYKLQFQMCPASAPTRRPFPLS